MAKKPSLGRQKIQIAKIEIKNHLQVTFSKRRSGLFKKACELCTLCGVEIAFVVFSPAGKVFSFGHPNVESIIGRYITRNPPHQSLNNSLTLVESHRGATLRGLNFQLTQVVNELEKERKRGRLLDIMRQVSQSQFWWEAPVEKLGFSELEQLRNSMEELKKNVSNQANKILMENGSCNNLTSFCGDEFRVFDLFESKPDLINQALANNPNVYGHGFF